MVPSPPMTGTLCSSRYWRGPVPAHTPQVGLQGAAAVASRVGGAGGGRRARAAGGAAPGPAGGGAPGTGAVGPRGGGVPPPPGPPPPRGAASGGAGAERVPLTPPLSTPPGAALED